MNPSLKTEIIAVGTELLLGQIANTNAQWISEQLAMNGIDIYYHTVVGDNLQRLSAIFKQAEERSDVILVTGGLGPTEDDLSREAFQQLSQIPIVEEPYSMQRIESYYQEQQREMTPNNRRQARVFENSTVLYNKVGMAPGNIVQHQGKYWIFLPGVPQEMKQLMKDGVLPYLSKLNGDTIIESSVLKFIGIGESALEDRLSTLFQEQRNPTIAPLAKSDGVTIRITAKASSSEKARQLIRATKNQILDEVGDYYYGDDEETIEEKVFAHLLNNDQTISSAESLTGGLFAGKLVNLPAASSVFKGTVVCYTSEIKEKILQVPKQLIEKEGTISEACAMLLAKNVCNLMQTSVGISFTGVAGPEEAEGKKVGTVFIAIYDRSGYQYVEKCFFPGDRQQIRYRSVVKGFELLQKYLKINKHV